MTRSPIFWIATGVVGTWAFHRWVKPMASTK